MNDQEIKPCGRCGRMPNKMPNVAFPALKCKCGLISTGITERKCIDYWNATAADYKRDCDLERKMAGE